MKNRTMLFNKSISIYLVFNIIYNLFGWVVPIKKATPGDADAIIYAIMGILGILLVLVDFIRNDYWRKTKYCWVLYAFICVMGISSVLNISYGYMSNAKTILWTLIQFTLFYSFYQRIEREKFIDFFSKLWFAVGLFWMIPILYSILQFFRMNSYYINIWEKNVRQGFVENRLFGVFNDPNYAAMMSLLLIIGIFFIKNTEKRWKRNCYIAYGILQFIYIVLSGSRTVQVCLLVTVFIFVYTQLRNKRIALKGYKVVLSRIIFSMICLVFVLVLVEGTRRGMELASGGLNSIEAFHQYAQDTQKELEGKKSKTGTNMMNSDKTKDMLHRKDGKKGNISNNRVTIWKSYLGGIEQHLLFGMSPRNSIQVFVKENPNSYIAQTEYETHNGYLSLIVCTGIVGSLIMAIFIVLNIKDVLKNVVQRQFISMEYLGCILIIGNIFMFTFFLTDLFFVNNIIATLFWVFLGAINYWSVGKNEIS